MGIGKTMTVRERKVWTNRQEKPNRSPILTSHPAAVFQSFSNQNPSAVLVEMILLAFDER